MSAPASAQGTSSKKPYPSIRVFQKDWMERTTHVHPIVPLLVWAPVVTYFLYVSFSELPSWQVIGAGAMGFLIWTLTEYTMHRFVFHFPAEGPTQERIQFLLHGLHHSDPIDPTRLVMPPVMSIPLATLFYFTFRSVVGPELIAPFFAFFIIGYLCYDYIHYAVHHFNPRTKVGKTIKQHHMLHHYVSPNARWGVSTPIWDHVFGSLEEKRKERHV